MYNPPKFRIPRKGHVWAFYGGPRYDIVKDITFIKQGKKKCFVVIWESGCTPVRLKDLASMFEYKGFYMKFDDK